MIRRLYDWVMGLAGHPRASLWLFIVAFMESSFFPIPPHIMLIPMVLADRSKAWWHATVVTVGSVLGGIAGYVIGYALFDQIGKPVLDFYGMGEKFATFAQSYNEFGAWIVFTAGVTPFPYKVITIASGATALNFWVFMIASIAARSLIFFVIAGLLYFFGQPIRDFIERRLGLMFTIFLVLLFGGFIAIKYLVH
ncbi:MAG: DedA family protein [Alphaproteobacteria bacterium]|nr:DedA family protein [Alphaproteobacteria bacterium]